MSLYTSFIPSWQNLVAFFYWDPPREAFVIPIINFPIYWYSLFFAFGFFVAYFVVVRLLALSRLKKNPLLPKTKTAGKTELLTVHRFADKLAWYLFLGMLIGARLGHVIFYDWEYFSQHPLEIFLTREGGLASHGAGIGILIGFLLFWWKNKQNSWLSYKKILDFLAIGASFAASCIRIGNFFNQEILGTEFSGAWAVKFGHPMDSHVSGPCHPVQIYEALFYFFVFVFLLSYELFAKNKPKDGVLFALFLVFVFSFRFIIEWFKVPQSRFDILGMHMGQILSIPFLLLGVVLFFFWKNTRRTG